MESTTYNPLEVQFRILEKARQKLATKENWTCGVLARDKEGNRADLIDPTACSFCLVGAIMSSRSELIPKELWTDTVFTEAYQLLLKNLPSHESLVAFNDAPGRTFEEVSAVIDTALAQAKAQLESSNVQPSS